MNRKDEQDKQFKRQIEEYKKHPMINLADSINPSKIVELSQLSKKTILVTITIIGILFFISLYSN